MISAQLGDMQTLEKQALKGTIALVVELLGDLGISGGVEQPIDGSQSLWRRETRLGKRWRQGHRDGLRCSSLEPDVCHNLLSLVDGHIFDHQTRRTLAFSGQGVEIIPELAEAFWGCLDLSMLL